MSSIAFLPFGLAFFLVCAWVTAAGTYPLFNASVAKRPRLARASLLVSVLPWVVGMALTMAAFLPGDPHMAHLPGCHCATSMPG